MRDGFSFIAPLGHFDLFIHERLFLHHWPLAGALIFPCRDVSEIIVIAFGFAIFVLKFVAEMTAAGLTSFEPLEEEQFVKSMKSATRPAYSRFWLNSPFSPVTLTFFQNSSRNSGMRWRHSFRPASLRAMPHFS